jgi:hypothetical protein
VFDGAADFCEAGKLLIQHYQPDNVSNGTTIIAKPRG